MYTPIHHYEFTTDNEPGNKYSPTKSKSLIYNSNHRQTKP